jgi:hypothetical protein
MKLLLISLASLLFASLLQSPDSEIFTKLFALKGTWVMQTKKGPLFEKWTIISNSELQGKSFKLNGADTIVLEKVRLIENTEGIFYIPVVEQQNQRQPVSFKMISIENNKFTFENKVHDFPQRIIYNVVSSDSLVARIEGERKGVKSGSDYFFKKN